MEKSSHQSLIISDGFPDLSASGLITFHVDSDFHFKACETSGKVLVAQLLDVFRCVAQPT